MAIRTLVLHARYIDVYSYFDDWLEAFVGAPELEAAAVDICRASPQSIDEADLVVLLHSTNADTLDHVRPWERALAERRRAKVVVFVGNEYNMPRSHLGLGEKRDFLRRVRPDLIASQLLQATAEGLYGDTPGARVRSIPHALNPRRFRPGPPGDERPIDLGVRTARYTPLLGDNDRMDMVRYFSERPLPRPLRLDLAAGGGRFGPDEWAAFLARCKGTVTTEAGTSFIERDDRTVNRIADHLARRHPSALLFGLEKRVRHPWLRARMATVARGLTATLIRHGLSRGVDAIYEGADLADLEPRFFRQHPRDLDGKCISSRHFEAMGTKTCQLMFPGRFNDILEADRHYIAIARDFSNVEAALDRFLDPVERARVVDAAHELAHERHTHAHRVREVVSAVA
jgi:hypothetical protein